VLETLVLVAVAVAAVITQRHLAVLGVPEVD
jgi:hypothetical protein